MARPAVDWRDIIVGQMRTLECIYAREHANLTNWARWGVGRNFEAPFLSVSALWKLPGESDPDRDPEAVPAPRPVPLDEKGAIELDVVINNQEYPAVWRKVICVHYLPPKYRSGHYAQNPVPEWQRPIFARMTAESYLTHLDGLLQNLAGNP